MDKSLVLSFASLIAAAPHFHEAYSIFVSLVCGGFAVYFAFKEGGK